MRQAPRKAPRKRLAAVPDTDPAVDGGSRVHGPYSKRPHVPALLPSERTALLAEVLDGVRLYAFDRQALQWVCRWADTPTFLALLGIIERARQAASQAAADCAAADTREATTADGDGHHQAEGEHPKAGRITP